MNFFIALAAWSELAFGRVHFASLTVTNEVGYLSGRPFHAAELVEIAERVAHADVVYCEYIRIKDGKDCRGCR
jgi:hypothetical protein